MAKSADAFRTISEVAEWLETPAHVLRFWESKFSQVKPVKRAGGRRYYRPADMKLLGGIKKLLHDDGMTIKGAQKFIREHGVGHVSDLSQPLDDLTVAVIEGTAEDVTDQIQAAEAAPVEAADAAVDAPEETIEIAEPAPDPEPDAPQETDVIAATPEDTTEEIDAPAQDSAPAEQQPVTAPAETDDEAAVPTFRSRARDAAPVPEQTEGETEESQPIPSAKPEKFEVSPPAPKETPKPRIIDVGPLPDLADFPAQPSILSSLSRITSLTAEEATAIQPLLARLTRLRASMGAAGEDAGKD